MQEYIKEVVPRIEQAATELIPKRVNESWIKENIGNFSFKIKEKIWEESCSKPFYELFQRGGKRLRPVLVCLSHDTLKGNSSEVYLLSLIPEIIHTGSLIVDDIEDNSKLRRGKPSIHEIYGTALALNNGNFLYFYALNLLKNSTISDDKKLKIYNLISEELTKLHLGQGMDIYWSKEKNYEIELEECLQMYEYKTGSLIKVSMLIGAILAETNEENINVLGNVAYKLGIAFQLRDDILNLKPEEAWGKETGEDITEGKITYLVINTLSKANKEDKENLIKILSSTTKDQEKIKEAITIIEKYNSFKEASAYAKELITQAKESINKLLEDSEEKRIYLEILDYAVERKK